MRFTARGLYQVFKRAHKQLFRNKRVTLLGVLLLVFLITSYSMLLFHDNLSRTYRELIEYKYPSEVLFCRTSEEIYSEGGISADFISDVLKVSHIQAYNRTSMFNAHLVTTEVQGKWDDSKNGSIPLVVQADINTSLNSYFRSGQLELVSGQYPDCNNKGILVDEEYFGSSTDPSFPENLRIEIETSRGNYLVEYPIAGTYKAIYPIEHLINDVPVRQNVVFVNEESVSNLLLDQDNMTFFLDSHSAMDDTLSELRTLNYDHDKYDFFPSLSLDISTLLSSIRVGEASRIIIMMIFGVISTGIMLVYLINDYLRFQQNIRIYSLLGEKTQIITLEYCLRIIEILGISCIPSCCFSLISQPIISEKLLINLTKPITEGSFSTSFDLQRRLLQHSYYYNASLKEFFVSVSYIALIITVFLLIMGFITRKTLTNGKRKTL